MGTSTKGPAVYQAVEVSGSKWVHARQPGAQVTLCGFQSAGGSIPFIKTTEEPTCPFCAPMLAGRMPA